MSDQTLEKVRGIVSDVLGVAVEEINENSSVENLESWDSVMMINILMALEEEFGISLSPQDALELFSVELIVKALRERN